MAFNADIEAQFEFLQEQANSRAAFDPIIGQRSRRPARRRPTSWGANSVASERTKVEVPSIRQSVVMRGGEYFFMPSLPFLRGELLPAADGSLS
jgi:hypothetical protein